MLPGSGGPLLLILGLDLLRPLRVCQIEATSQSHFEDEDEEEDEDDPEVSSQDS